MSENELTSDLERYKYCGLRLLLWLNFGAEDNE